MNDATAVTTAKFPNHARSVRWCGVALLDGQGRLKRLDAALASLLNLRHDDLLGRPLAELPQPLASIFSGDLHCVEATGSDGQTRTLQCEAHLDGEDPLVVVRDITELERLSEENKRLKRLVEELKLNDELTGMPNRRAISQALELQVSRSRRYQNPLSVALVHISVSDDQLPAFSGGGDALVLAVSRFLRDRLRWVDQIGRWDTNVFILVLPETEREDALKLVEKIQNEQPAISVPPPWDKIQPQLTFGLGYWKKGDDMRTLLRQVAHDLTQQV